MENTESELWLQKTWRPISAMVYSAICISDFIILPVLWSVIQAHYQGSVSSQWNPLTLQMGGFVHFSFGAILGISAWTRGKEKLSRITTEETK